MHVIPVIDIKGGLVVHARGGNRSAYAPLVSPLVEGSAPVTVVEGLMRLYRFERLYVADLDGIMQGSADLGTLHALSEAFPDLEIWLDNGMPSSGVVVEHFQELARIRPVVGTESLSHTDEFVALCKVIGMSTGRQPILSLDFKGGEMLGADLLSSPELWPDTVIAMTLDAVGADAGPNTALIKHLRATTGERTRVVAAGGVRGKEDLKALAAAGADAALVATALHTGKLKAGDLVEVAGLHVGVQGS